MDQLNIRQRQMQQTVLAWGACNRRDLPWRRTRDPWAILIAESMLSQTQVNRVAKAFPPFIAIYDTPQALKDAPTQELLRAWQGLGYNRRALRLRDAARSIVDDYGGHVPSEFAALHSLPGVGNYIAHAVLAQGFDIPVGAVDTNVRRILTRSIFGQPVTSRELQGQATSLVPANHCWEWTQSLFDFGALLCRRQPACPSCPLRATCRWGGVGIDPYLPPVPQSRFEGSHRQHRGRVVAAYADGWSTKEELREQAALSPEHFELIYQELEQEGFFGQPDSSS